MENVGFFALFIWRGEKRRSDIKLVEDCRAESSRLLGEVKYTFGFVR